MYDLHKRCSRGRSKGDRAMLDQVVYMYDLHKRCSRGRSKGDRAMLD